MAQNAGPGRYRIRNGEVLEDLPLPVANLLDVLEPRATEPAADPLAAVRQALERPFGSPRLAELATGARQVVIVVDDMTRPTPVHLLLPPVLDELAGAGVQDENIIVLVANGTHRPMTWAELMSKVGVEAMRRVRVENHMFDDLDDLVDLGTTPSGIPVTVNRLVAEADLVIGIGNIVPHRYCGWAGGAKIIQPGVSGEATTAATHLMITRYPDVGLGTVDNTVRSEIESVGDQVGLRFIVNTVLNRNQEVVDVFAGDFRTAFRAGVDRAREVFGAPFREQADVVVASAHPSDINLWQAGKALYSGQLVVREGGVLILASPFTEGIGEHGSFAQLMAMDYASIDALLDRGEVEDRIGAAAALACAIVREHCEVWLAGTGVSDEEARLMSMRRFDTAREALAAALDREPDARVTLMSTATEILPIRTGGPAA